MKKLLAIGAFSLIWHLAGAQTKVTLKDNEFTALHSNGARDTLITRNSHVTLYTFTSAGKVYPVYISTGGAYYVVRVSKKTGKQYRQYLKVN